MNSDLKNVLVAGRSISAEQVVQGRISVTCCCLVMGEAAGLAASMAASGDRDVHHVDTDMLRRNLRANGAFLPAGEWKKRKSPSLRVSTTVDIR